MRLDTLWDFGAICCRANIPDELTDGLSPIPFGPVLYRLSPLVSLRVRATARPKTAFIHTLDQNKPGHVRICDHCFHQLFEQRIQSGVGTAHKVGVLQVLIQHQAVDDGRAHLQRGKPPKQLAMIFPFR